MQTSETTSRSAWLAVGSVAAGTFLLVTTEFLPVALLTEIALAMGVSEGQAGLAVAVPGAVAACSAPLVLLGSRQLDRRLLLWVLTAAIVVSNVIVALSSNFIIFLAARFLLGIAVGGLWAIGIAAGRRLVAQVHGGKATAIISAGIGVGTVVGVPVGAYLGGIFGWRLAFAGAAVFGILVLIAQMALLPKLPTERPAPLTEFMALLRVARARIGLAGITILAGGHFLAYTFLEIFLTQVTRTDSGLLSSVLIVYAVGGLAGGFIAEWTARTGYVRAMLIFCVMQALVIALLAMTGSALSLVFLWALLWGVVFGGVPVVSQIWMYEAAPNGYESGAAMMVAFLQVGIALGPLAGGVILDTQGLTTTFLVAAAVSGLAIPVFGLAGRPIRTATQST
ncbi:MFS transporter [Mesorhizobium sp. YC-39]|uniref:MFS transporter n=1 Tax=unclassified Mesorhizobium TaxID=325217 RepID=UPI0021E7B115|nr:MULTISPECIES: MFS transporter [unclassified Mesorhizobium]MCV3205592.1 MFS transporter [Mesorhizobium sp. YC-2]MCV3228009.1 MFS transporter [Mesorhizobium sp. YC-39]